MIEFRVTTCTVAPWTLTPASSALMGVKPGKEGNRDGWMFRMRFGNRAMKSCTQHAHETCQHHVVWCVCVDGIV